MRRNDYGHEDFARGRYDDCVADVGTKRPSALVQRNSMDCYDVESSAHANSELLHLLQ